jgi:PAS domain S-box-containing protein
VPRRLEPLEAAHWCQVALASIGDAVVVTDAVGGVLFMNPVAEALTGWPQSEAAGRPLTRVFRIVNEQTRQPVADPVAEVFARGVVVGLANHTLLIAKDGTERPIDDSAAPIRDAGDGIAGAVLVFRDVSERRRAELAASEALTYAEGIVDTIREPLVILDAGLRVRTANRSFYQTFAVSPDATEGRLIYELGDRQWDVPKLRELLEAILPRDSHFSDYEVDHEFAGIGRRTMLLNARRLDRRGDGEGLILLAIEDVTGQKSAATALAVSETRYRRLFETAQDGILILNGDTGKIFDANPYLAHLLGYGRDELVGKELWEIGLFDHAEASRVAFQTLQQEGYIRYEDLPLLTKDGRGIAVEFVSNVYLVDSHRVIQCNIRDVTDRKRAEEALREAHDQLEARVKERTAELATLNETLTAEVAGHRRTEGRLREQEHDRRVGREIQNGLLPRAVPRLRGFEIQGRSLAAHDVGGDCFDFIPLPGGGRDCLGVFVADASGHGIGAALLAGQTRAYLRALALTSSDVGLLLGLTNTRLATDAASDHFVTALLLSLDPTTRSLIYSSAGHVPGYVLDPRGQARAILPSTGIPLGIDPYSEFPAAEAVVLEPGDLVLLLTDGIVEAASPAGELFGPERALAIVRQHRQQTPGEILEALFDAASAFCAQNILDDLSAVIIKCGVPQGLWSRG